MTTPVNLFADLPDAMPAELFQTLLASPTVRIERIVSRGHASPGGFWYDQDEAEWILVLEGAARLSFEGEEPIDLQPGSFINIAAHRRHRVDWTDPTQPTIWLAVFYPAAESSPPGIA